MDQKQTDEMLRALERKVKKEVSEQLGEGDLRRQQQYEAKRDKSLSPGSAEWMRKVNASTSSKESK